MRPARRLAILRRTIDAREGAMLERLAVALNARPAADRLAIAWRYLRRFQSTYSTWCKGGSRLRHRRGEAPEVVCNRLVGLSGGKTSEEIM